METQLVASPLAEFTRFDVLTPALYTSADDGIAIVFNTENGCALLTSQYGSNITACPLRIGVFTNPQEASERLLKERGFSKQLLPPTGWVETVSKFFKAAGFTSRQVDDTLQMCLR